MEFAAELQASLQEFTSTGIVEVHENGGRVAPFSGMSWEVRGPGEMPLLHLWSEQFNLTRRVLAIPDHSERRLALAVERFGRSKPDRLEFIRRDFERSAGELSRVEFCDRLARLLAEQFPDETLESLTASPDLEHSLSGNYCRGILRRGSAWVALLAVPDGESADTTDSSLTFALLWLARAPTKPARNHWSAARDSSQGRQPHCCAPSRCSGNRSRGPRRKLAPRAPGGDASIAVCCPASPSLSQRFARIFAFFRIFLLPPWFCR